jgi:hypothetical protein
MSEFLKKSLAVSKWNELLNCCVYGIHDLLLYYLKHQLSDEEKKVCNVTSTFMYILLKVWIWITVQTEYLWK